MRYNQRETVKRGRAAVPPMTSAQRRALVVLTALDAAVLLALYALWLP